MGRDTNIKLWHAIEALTRAAPLGERLAVAAHTLYHLRAERLYAFDDPFERYALESFLDTMNELRDESIDEPFAIRRDVEAAKLEELASAVLKLFERRLDDVLYGPTKGKQSP